MTEKAAKKPAKPKTAPPVLTPGFKAFDAQMKCRDFQFEVGKTYEHAGKIALCQAGFHYVTVPFDAWNYYAGSMTFARVTGENAIGHEPGSTDSKVVTARLTIEASIDLPEWIKAQAASVIALCKTAVGALAGKKNENAAATGVSGHAAATGDYGHAAATGYSGHAGATGDYGHAAATGDYGHAAATGDYGHAAATGESARSAATGKNSIAAALNYAGRAKAGPTGAIMLAEIGVYPNCKIKAVFASKVGENGIKPDTWYRLENGKPVECV